MWLAYFKDIYVLGCLELRCETHYSDSSQITWLRDMSAVFFVGSTTLCNPWYSCIWIVSLSLIKAWQQFINAFNCDDFQSFGLLSWTTDVSTTSHHCWCTT